MKKVTLIVHQNYLEEVIKNLYETGLIEIINITKENKEILEKAEKGEITQDVEICTEYELRLTRLIDILNKVKTKKTGLKAFINPELPKVKSIKERPLDEIFLDSNKLLDEIEKNILELENKKIELDEKLEKIKFDIDQLNFLKDFEFDISHIGVSNYLIVKAGKTNDIDTLKNEIDKIDNALIFYKQFVINKKPEWAVLIAAYISEKEKIEKISHEKITEFKFNVTEGIPKLLVNSLKNNIKEIEKHKKVIILKLQDYIKNQLNDLLALREEIQLERIKKEISKNFAKTKTTYIIQGWILEKDEKNLKKSVENVSKDYLVYNSEKPSENPDNPPTYIKTPKWAEGFKSLVKMFAYPKYNEINPTIIMGVFFILFFGFMLGDAGYGLIILLLSIYGYKKIGKYSKLICNWSFMGIWMGITAIIIGLLTNSFFGDLIPRFIYGDPTELLYRVNIAGITLPANSIKDPITILIIALIFGLIHLNVGVVLGLIQAFKRKKYKEAFTIKFCWIPLQIGGGLLISYFILNIELSNMLFYLAIVLTIIGLIQLFISQGPIGFFNITGYVGDWLSYARLLALGLATSGMALAFNVVSQLIGNMIPFIGIFIMIVFLFFAHLVNLFLQSLGAGIHSLRLQYVEFFNRFYEGGGREFTPFKVRRKYTKIEKIN
ncbi:MAG: V-type ATP synthase subunit I [Thermoplasmatota archaeon]|jgi:V/A-type H+-transporting ATPase subunit I